MDIEHQSASLRELMGEDWVDVEATMVNIAIAIGLIPKEGVENWKDLIYNNSFSGLLYDILTALRVSGVLAAMEPERLAYRMVPLSEAFVVYGLPEEDRKGRYLWRRDDLHRQIDTPELKLIVDLPEGGRKGYVATPVLEPLRAGNIDG